MNDRLGGLLLIVVAAGIAYFWLSGAFPDAIASVQASARRSRFQAMRGGGGVDLVAP